MNARVHTDTHSLPHDKCTDVVKMHCLDMELWITCYIRSSETFNEQSLHKQYTHDIYWIYFTLSVNSIAFSAYYDNT